MCSACASAGKGTGEGGVVQARPTVAHFTLECGRREASVAHYGQPSCSLSWLPLSIFAVGKTLFASFVDFVRRTAEVIYLPFPNHFPSPHFYIFLTVQRASCNVFCSCRQHILICFSAVSYAVSAAHLSASLEHATQTKFNLRFQFAFDFTEKIGQKNTSGLKQQLQNDAVMDLIGE